jgi:hypothetical protein
MELKRQNTALQQRISQVRPAIGSIDIWRKDYERSINRKNTIFHSILAGQSPLHKRIKDNMDYISSLPRMQLRNRYKTDV